jgi:ATPase subunit of ABC transporter with duplicated ATPase domains
LSGGERARVALAELILSESNMLHDRSVLSEVCNIIWEIKNNEVKKYLGNYDDFHNDKSVHSS